MKLKIIFFPSLFTCLNFLLGVLSIMHTIQENYHMAAWFIILAILCDGMDGKIARLTSTETQFGFEFDSMADLIASGAAPGFLAYSIGLDGYFWGSALCFIYIFAGGYRLARFNVIQGGDRSEGYIGLPIPIAGMTIASFSFYEGPIFRPEYLLNWFMLLGILALLMLSSISYHWPRVVFSKRLTHFLPSLLIVLALMAMAVLPYWSLFPLMVLYILLGIGKWCFAWIKGDVKISGLFELSIDK
ncbi:CDP-diacylglycerol--serine O-phosphatidyltransferase [bacterium I07]|nr:CDP-diacylglycerol--serine O-phosphatidyltransferase [bacterium I07]